MEKSKTKKLNTFVKYKIMPDGLASRTDLSSDEKVVYSRMANDYFFYLDKRGKYSPGQNLSIKTGVPERTMTRVLRSLTEKGYIFPVSKKRGCATIWHVNPVKDDGTPSLITPIRTDTINALLNAEDRRQIEAMTGAPRTIEDHQEEAALEWEHMPEESPF